MSWQDAMKNRRATSIKRCFGKSKVGDRTDGIDTFDPFRKKGTQGGVILAAPLRASSVLPPVGPERRRRPTSEHVNHHQKRVEGTCG